MVVRNLMVALIVLAITAAGPRISVAATHAGELYVGSKSDIGALITLEHKLYPNKEVEGIHVVGDYALMRWIVPREASGVGLFKRASGGEWGKITQGGGAMAKSDLVGAGVPAPIASQLLAGWPK
jgi:hypothetical protein